MIAAAKEGTGLEKLDLLESRIRALLEERDRLRARVRELEGVFRGGPKEEPLRTEHARLLQERQTIRRKVESLLRALRGLRAEG